MRFQPQTHMLGSYGSQLAESASFADQIAVLAAVLGVMALLLGILSSSGGRGRFSTSIAIVLGLVAISYPVLTALNVVTGPLTSHVP